MPRSSSGKLDRPAAVRACRPTPTMTRESLEALITSRSGLCDELRDDTPDSSEGRLDSSDRIELAAHLGAEARTELGAREVTLENLDSIEETLRCVESKKSAA